MNKPGEAVLPPFCWLKQDGHFTSTNLKGAWLRQDGRVVRKGLKGVVVGRAVWA